MSTVILRYSPSFTSDEGSTLTKLTTGNSCPPTL